MVVFPVAAWETALFNRDILRLFRLAFILLICAVYSVSQNRCFIKERTAMRFKCRRTHTLQLVNRNIAIFKTYAGVYTVSIIRQGSIGKILSKVFLSFFPQPWNEFRIIAVGNDKEYFVFYPFHEYIQVVRYPKSDRKSVV